MHGAVAAAPGPEGEAGPVDAPGGRAPDADGRPAGRPVVAHLPARQEPHRAAVPGTVRPRLRLSPLTEQRVGLHADSRRQTAQPAAAQTPGHLAGTLHGVACEAHDSWYSTCLSCSSLLQVVPAGDGRERPRPQAVAPPAVLTPTTAGSAAAEATAAHSGDGCLRLGGRHRRHGERRIVRGQRRALRPADAAASEAAADRSDRPGGWRGRGCCCYGSGGGCSTGGGCSAGGLGSRGARVAAPGGAADRRGSRTAVAAERPRRVRRCAGGCAGHRGCTGVGRTRGRRQQFGSGAGGATGGAVDEGRRRVATCVLSGPSWPCA